MKMRRVFVANRGEIAVRIVRSCRELGLETVVGFSEADRGSLAARMADRAVCIGPGSPAQSYLNVGAVVQAAIGTGCDAIHPGYGFLSENPALAAAACENGLRFVGPPAEVIELAGDKLRSREVAAEAGLPVVPGGEVSALADALRFAEEAGYPVLLKAAAGGGGRGIKLARDREELERLFGVALAEAGAAFGDERLYVERFIRSARHVEVQVAADEHGGVLHFGERDCSVQRRYQKIVEEAPAPGLDAGTRAALHGAAVAFAREIGYRNLGTVEFVVDAESGEFFFMEMNCRIQVEHPVTEAVTGRDLVADQLRIAADERLGLSQEEVEFRGHAIECRLTAEDPAHGFRPTPGRISRFSVPEIEGLRVDTHCEEGTLVPPYYDSLLAKLISHAGDRDGAIERMLEALEGLVVEGVPTNRELLMHVLAHPDFTGAAVDTTWLEEAVLAA
ncbi:Biotin carboxylase [Rubrobacter xylanophilus DSM 9941]|uniref:acetyl-CoA carboxylase biotin carboxylase subunit n=1 Tax=Rubrobacter xylanophilus TaxID=49319 RepID=UPI001C63EE7C|nr:Biotin carboxylase [Rubrobacter xylanophilus DSM 9941]